MTKYNFFSLALAGLLLSTTACEKDKPKEPELTPDADAQQYIIAAQPLALEGVADYLLAVDQISEGSISLLGNGVEQDGTYRYYTSTEDKFFSMLYGQGNPGAVTAYNLDKYGRLNELIDFQSETVQAFATVGNDILMIKIPRDGSEYAYWYQLDTESLLIENQGQINVFELANNGEEAFFTWLTAVGNGKVYAPYMCINLEENDRFGTYHPDSAWVAVYSYPDMTLERVIKDDRTSYIGTYFNNGLVEVENGDLYAFSASDATLNGTFTSSKPSAVTRIVNGATEFDQSYFFNLEEASGGYYFTAQSYAGNGKFVVMMQPLADQAKYTVGKKLAIVDVINQQFTWVSGLPSADQIVSLSTNNYSPADQAVVYLGITTQSESNVYRIDAETATATKGLQVEGGNITAIRHIHYTE